jgi:hypothetical protein
MWVTIAKNHPIMYRCKQMLERKHSMRKRLVLFLAVALIATSVFVFVGLPVNNLGWSSVSAQYDDVCKSSYQARYGGPVALYSDSALTNLVTTLSSGVATKLLVCDDTFAQTGGLKYLKVQFVGKIYYTAAGVGLVPRYFKDSQN